MQSQPARWLRIGRFLVVVSVILTVALAALPVQADEGGSLQLKVQSCFSSTWLADASVSVIIYRPGVGNVDTGSGTTNSVGYVAIRFDDLEDGDEAHVTVTPSGDAPGSNHTYYWVVSDDRDPGLWDVGILGDDQCQDGWYDQTNNIILCLHS